ncbi:MAG: hypothetical protein J0I07_19990 [Myxococcales bacterium]|nr:hypothetical protein [Myxococcales bacterium]
MRFTRRLLDPYFSAALVLVGCSATAGAAVSCSSDEVVGIAEPLDPGSDASSATDDASALDAGPLDDARSRDAAWFDGGPLPVSCTSAPCAVSLVTTLGASDADRGEGFCALLQDSTVACWGANQAGQLGRGEEADPLGSATAARVTGLTDVSQLDHTCAVDKSGGVWCWGTGPYLRNDAGASTTERTPVKLPLPPAKRVAMGAEVACATVDDGLLCWGTNTSGQLASFETSSASDVLPPRSMAIPPGAPIRDLVVGKATFTLREDGATLSWGANPPLARVSSLVPDPRPARIVLDRISSIDIASDSACATVGGIGYCWGTVIPTVEEEQSEAKESLRRALPEPVVAPEPLVQIATTRTFITKEASSRIIEPQRWCAVAVSGAVYCWGYNASGQAGNGTKDYAFEPVTVKGLPEPAVQVKTMPNATCALLVSGKVYCWGGNASGQLGNGKFRVPSIVPQEVVLP